MSHMHPGAEYFFFLALQLIIRITGQNQTADCCDYVYREYSSWLNDNLWTLLSSFKLPQQSCLSIVKLQQSASALRQ